MTIELPKIFFLLWSYKICCYAGLKVTNLKILLLFEKFGHAQNSFLMVSKHLKGLLHQEECTKKPTQKFKTPFLLHSENFFFYLTNSLMTHGKTSRAQMCLYTLLCYLKFNAQKDSHLFLRTELLEQDAPPFLLKKFQKSNRLYIFPVPFQSVSTRRKLFFFFFQTPFRTLIKKTYRKQYAITSRTLFSIIMHVYYPETSFYKQTYANFISTGVSNRLYLHYRWRFK
jgi:hypothetical protein